MASKIDPLIYQKLTDFAQRRRNLILLRGVLATVGVLVASMIVVGMIDLLVPFLSDTARWLLSGAAYLGTALVAWMYGARPLLNSPSEREMARLLEHAEPKLREDLLSAVELGSNEGGVFDSAQFRELLQKDVSRRMENLQIGSLLPVALIRRSLQFAGIIAVILVGLTVATKMRLGTLLVRALVPGLDIARVSDTRIRIVEPEAGDRVVAQGDVVKLVVEIQGKLVDRARMEAIGVAETQSITEMKSLAKAPAGTKRFVAEIKVGRKDVSYRVQSGDGRTSYYKLTAVARPVETEFEKTYVYPTYAGMKTATVKEASGGVGALQGTEVDLKITTNQKVKSGVLKMDAGNQKVEIPLVVLADGRLGARIPIKISGNYRLDLVSAQTGFQNQFSPEYEIRAQADLRPTIVLGEPENDLISPANELVNIVGRATDDVGLAKVSQMIRVNEGAWKEVILDKNPGKEKRVQRDWDIFEEGVKEGDLLTTKLVATDFAGNTTDSRTLQINVVAAGFEMKRLSSLKECEALYTALKALVASAEVLGNASGVASEKSAEVEVDAPKAKKASGGLPGALEDFELKLSEAWMALNVPLRGLPGNHQSADLVLLGQMLSQINSSEVPKVRRMVDLWEADSGAAGASEWLGQVAGTVKTIKAMSLIAQETAHLMLAGEEIDASAELGMVLGMEQARILDKGKVAKTPEEWTKIATRFKTVLSTGKNVETVLDYVAARGIPLGVLARGIADTMIHERETIQTELEGTTADKPIQAILDRYASAIRTQTGKTFDARAELAGKLIATRLRLPAEPTKMPRGLVAVNHRDLSEEIDAVAKNIAMLRLDQAAVAKIPSLTPKQREAMVVAIWRTRGDVFK
ncbi:MAG: hypothetical protein NTX04_12405, partial [Verrucomicrobia bacterium]|nr:hypothetical protein [Verrucomicrobiota bacterium]